MELIVRNSKQLGTAIRRVRKKQALSQGTLGERMRARQATISKLETGEAATQVRTLMDALAALDLELVIRPRTTAPVTDLEDLF